jgi:exosortase
MGAIRWQRGWGWPQITAGLGLALIAGLVTSDAWADIYHIASRDEESSHAFLVPIVVAWLIWVRRRRLRACRPVGGWVGSLIVLFGWLCYSLGDTHLLQSVYHCGAILLVVGALLSVWGKDLLLSFFPAFVALLFMIPVPGRVRQRVAVPLETVTAEVTKTAYELAGESVERSGNVLSINGKEVAIAEACNGLRMVFALTLVSYAFAFGNPLRAHTRVIILVASPLSAIACNVIRLIPTVWLYGHSREGLADAFHDVSGWVMLGVSFLILVGIIRVLRWALVSVSQYTLAYD